jgi:hypothetical protein
MSWAHKVHLAPAFAPLLEPGTLIRPLDPGMHRLVLAARRSARLAKFVAHTAPVDSAFFAIVLRVLCS